MPTLLIDTNNREDLDLQTTVNFTYKLSHPIVFRKDSKVELLYCSIAVPADNSHLYFQINITGITSDTHTNNRNNTMSFVVPCNSPSGFRTTFYAKSMFDNVAYSMSEQSIQSLEVRILNPLGAVADDGASNLIILKYN